MAFAAVWQAVMLAHASDTIGTNLLWTVTTNLHGSGVRIAQAEAEDPNNPNPATAWEVNPGAAGVGQPTNLFTYFNGSSSTSFPNALGTESGHADWVAGFFYGLPGGIATNVAHVDNYEATYFVTIVVPYRMAINGDRVVNQSFVGDTNTTSQQTYDSTYDAFAAQYNTLFVSGVGNDDLTVNGGAVSPPSTCYNGIGVAAYGTNSYSSVGPTPDNGRAKPDITDSGPATGVETSITTPQVAGAAALLLQAGLRGDGGSDTNSAADMRTLKALLLNGAIKPADWTTTNSSPLDYRYGAGVLNVFNSCEQLTGGKHGYIVSTSVATNSPHPPTGATGTVSVLSGWDFNTNSSSATTMGMNHYYFDVTNSVSNATFTATATLVWNRQQNPVTHTALTNINNLDLFLYDANSSNLIAASTSLVDNVEHVFVPKLPAGRYDLQVVKNGGAIMTATETYALAFEFFSMSLQIASSGTNVALSWPIYPAGFVLESTPSLAPAAWSTFTNATPVVTNNQNLAVVGSSNSNLFFRLRRP